jgi:DNA-binding transcriptional LysR family regulator
MPKQEMQDTPQDGAELAPDAWAAVLAPRLAQFAVVARHQHVTRAARQLGMPQPTLSRALARLEADLGVTLFARQAARCG